MDSQKIAKLQAMITQADFLNSETKQVFLSKIPYLDENKFTNLWEIFEHDTIERKHLKQKKIEIFEKYKATVTGIYNRARQIVQNLKTKAAEKLEAHELSSLNQELNQL